jgi:hypothetical protein
MTDADTLLMRLLAERDAWEPERIAQHLGIGIGDVEAALVTAVPSRTVPLGAVGTPFLFASLR